MNWKFFSWGNVIHSLSVTQYINKVSCLSKTFSLKNNRFLMQKNYLTEFYCNRIRHHFVRSMFRTQSISEKKISSKFFFFKLNVNDSYTWIAFLFMTSWILPSLVLELSWVWENMKWIRLVYNKEFKFNADQIVYKMVW